MPQGKIFPAGGRELQDPRQRLPASSCLLRYRWSRAMADSSMWPGPHCASRAAWIGPLIPPSPSALAFRLGTPRRSRSHPRRERLWWRVTRDTLHGDAGCALWHSDADSAGGGSDSHRRGNSYQVATGDRRVPDGGGISEHHDPRADECRNTHGSAREPLVRASAEDFRFFDVDVAGMCYESTTRRPTGPALAPPSITTAAPLMYSARGDASISTPRATSSGVPGRPSEAALRAPSR